MSESENFSFNNFLFWKEKSEIDYIPLFVFLWSALNVWMRVRFKKETSDRNRLNMLKRSGGRLLGAFSGLILSQNTNGKRFRAEFGELHDALVSAGIPYNEDRWPNKAIDFECCIIDWNNGQPEFESILVLEEIDDELTSNNNPTPDEMNKIELNDDLSVENDPERLSVLEEIDDELTSNNNSTPDEMNRIELNDDLSVENDPERLFAAYMEIVYQIRCTLIHGDLNTDITDIVNKRVVRQLYLTLSMVIEDI